MQDWAFAQTSPSQELALLHEFSVMKQSASGPVEFRITVKEYVTPKEPTMHFLAQADKQTNQKTAPYTPSGWGRRSWRRSLSAFARPCRPPFVQS
ncbi:MAG TPA: hypothetical protein VME43_17300 [Bryobacteraceae bacterium]|nr:hypothetical protein [Bryobacteraceae bacterium]